MKVKSNLVPALLLACAHLTVIAAPSPGAESKRTGSGPHLAEMLSGEIEHSTLTYSIQAQEGCVLCNGNSLESNTLTLRVHDEVHDPTEVHIVAIREGYCNEKDGPPCCPAPEEQTNGFFSRRDGRDDEHEREFRCPGKATVRVSAGHKSAILVLSAYDPTVWTVECEEGSRLSAIYLTGYNEQRLASAPPGARILKSSFFLGSDRHRAQNPLFEPFYISFGFDPSAGDNFATVPQGVSWGSYYSKKRRRGYDGLVDEIPVITGHPIKTFRARHCVSTIVID